MENKGCATSTRAIKHWGLDGYSNILPRIKFSVTGQESSPLSQTFHTTNVLCNADATIINVLSSNRLIIETYVKMRTNILTFLLVLSLIISCQKEDKYSGIYDIKGKVVFDNGQIATNSDIFINSEWKTTTDNAGNFNINNVDAGNYKLKAANSDSSGYSEIEIEIDLTSDLDLDELLLPNPITLLNPIDITSHSLKLIWNRSMSDDYREYKIYIHNSSALDETTGTLLHIATDKNDTILDVNEGDFWWGGSTLSPNTTYYFRVFVMNSYGRMSGSNIIEATTSLWDNADEFTHNYIIQLESSFAAQGDLTGIDWDGNYFWMLYFKEQGGFYDNNLLTLVKYDPTEGTVLDTLVFDDSNYFSEGIAWDGTNVWLSLGTYIQAVNIEEETFDKCYYAGDVTVDLSWNGENLVLLDVWNKVLILNPDNGNIINQFVTPFVDIGYSGEKGVAARENEIWIINNWHNEIAICDNSGNHIGVADVDFLQDGFTANYHRIPMCFMEDKLVIALDSQVRIYSIKLKES